ncbi:MAG: hypothetical protein WBH50_25760 [Fuerstiella sp.]
MAEQSTAALVTFAIYTAVVMLLAVLSGRVSRGKEFVGEYFLGSRSLGVWAFALTFAATNASGGTFMGFPALIYTHGWSLAFWIAGFMTLPLLSMGLLGKRLNRVSRETGAVTIPEVFAAKMKSDAAGVVATCLLVFFMFFYLLAQFKAGGKILSTLLGGEPTFQAAALWVSERTSGLPWFGDASGEYLLCLAAFAMAVVGYVVYGGFRAIVWTDVMQGVVMLVGVVIMLALALYQVGGIGNATRKMAAMTPPEHCDVRVVVSEPQEVDIVLPKGSWIKTSADTVRLAQSTRIVAGDTESAQVAGLRLTARSDIDAVSMSSFDAEVSVEVSVEVLEIREYAYGAGKAGVYLSNPGPSANSGLGFLAISSALSFFIFWPFGATGQPANMVRLMAFKDNRTLRVSIVTVTVYYNIIFFALLLIFCCGRVLMPGMEIDPDRTMPDLASHLTAAAGVPWLAGLVVAAPFAAVMSSVDSFLLMVSSSLVRDVYQRHFRPDAPERVLRRMSYAVTTIVGLLAVVMVVNPPMYLQDLIVFASGGLAACFLVPMLLLLYWPQFTSAGAIAGMLGGTAMHLVLTVAGYLTTQQFSPYELLGMNPFVWDLVMSAILAWSVSIMTQPTAQPKQGLRP